MSDDPLLAVRGLCKRYSAPVLVDFDFTLRRGEVHALIGGNGAGKSTFARILAGLTASDRGDIALEGRVCRLASRGSAAAHGLVIVLQELNIIPTLTVAENLFLHRLPHQRGWIRRAQLRAQAREALERVGLAHLDPDTPAGTLGVGQQQLVEIASALAQRCRILILDEPTAALSAAESENLFSRLRELRGEGVGMIYVSHRMDEIQRIADRVTVLRDGRRVATRDRQDVDTRELIDLMTGGTTARAEVRRTSHATGRVVLDVRALCAGRAVRGIDLRVHGGEVLGLAGLVGSGRTELLRAIYGADGRDGGEIFVRGTRVAIRQPADAVAAGIGMVPEDRKAHGLLLEQPVTHNASMAALPRFARHGWLDPTAERVAVAGPFARLALKHAHPLQPIRELSGGNQQKAVLARWLLRESEILLLDEPTRGIDVSAKAVIYDLIGQLAAMGRAIVVVSSETPELMAICDRIVVLSAGRVAAEFTSDSWSEDRINRAAFHGYTEH